MVQQKKVPSDKESEQPEFGIHVNLSHRVAGIYNPSPLCEMGGRDRKVSGKPTHEASLHMHTQYSSDRDSKRP